MIHPPRVSVIIPSRTGAIDALRAQLIKQTFRDWELIVNTEPPTPARARNRGASRAAGQLLIFFDDDVHLGHPRLLEDLVDALELSVNVQAAIGVPVRLIKDATWFQRWQVWESFSSVAPAASDAAPLIDVPWYDAVSGRCLAMRRQTFERLGGFDERLVSGEDFELLYRLRQQGGRISFLSTGWVEYAPPRTFWAMVRKTVWYERGNAQVARKHPASGYRLVLRTRWQAAAYLLLRTIALIPLMGVNVSYHHRRPRIAFRPVSALLSYVGAWVYCLSWFAGPQKSALHVRRAIKRAKLFCVDRPHLKRRVKRFRYIGIRALSFLTGPTIDPRPRILGYHTVGDGQDDLSVSVERFRQHIEWLLRHRYQFLTLRQWWEAVNVGRAVSPRSVILSFDDGFQGVWRDAAPILAERGLAATIFVVTDYVGKTNAFDRPFLTGPELPLLRWDQLEALCRLGWDIQSHGRRHYPMVQLEPRALTEELEGSKRALEQRLGRSVDFFCYPYGVFDAQTVHAAASAGYAGALTCWSGPLPQGSQGDWYRLPRSVVDGLMSLQDFAAIFRQGYLRLNAGEFWLRRRFGTATECPFDEWDRVEGLPILRRNAAHSLERRAP
ncbi:MAG: polysaccharide deacetylase family protein [Candidatus Omnitrophica bacterium]|nr:polysaccharide deacetylase family protein [Candidatus Omnitrophota bacterium]